MRCIAGDPHQFWMDNESCFEAHLAKVEKPSMVSQRGKVERGGNKTH